MFPRRVFPCPLALCRFHVPVRSWSLIVVRVLYAPLVSVTTHKSARPRESGRILTPRRPRSNPLDLFCIPGGRGHQRVITVGHHESVRGQSDSLPKARFNSTNLANSVQLVTRKVEQNDGIRVGFTNDARQVHLVNLQHRVLGFGVRQQGSNDTVCHVVPAEVRGNVALCR